MIRTTVPAEPVRAHIRQLLAAEMTQAAICRAARTSPAIVNALLHGQYVPGRPPVASMSADIAARLLQVRFDPASVRPKATFKQVCTPGTRFTPVGHCVGRCLDCGQLAPVRSGDGGQVMFGHPRPEPDAAPPQELPAAVQQPHPSCGTPRGFERHRREKTEACAPCKGARRGYEQGWDAAMAKVRQAGPVVPHGLAEAVVRVCRAVVFRRPAPQIRDLAVQVVRIADAELCDDTQRRAA